MKRNAYYSHILIGQIKPILRGYKPYNKLFFIGVSEVKHSLLDYKVEFALAIQEKEYILFANTNTRKTICSVWGH